MSKQHPGVKTWLSEMFLFRPHQQSALDFQLNFRTRDGPWRVRDFTSELSAGSNVCMNYELLYLQSCC